MMQPPDFSFSRSSADGKPAVLPFAGAITGLNDGLALVSIGKDDGIQAGDTVLFSRGDSYLGEAVVTRSEANVSVCRISESMPELRKGDVVEIPAN